MTIETRRLGRLTLLAALAVAAALLVPASGWADNPVLIGDVGANDAFVISLADASGARVTHLGPGTYTLLVHDHSALHDFDLFGPNVQVATTVDGVGDSTFTITLTDGTYTFVCDPHSTRMHGTFTVGAAPPPAPAPVTAPKPTARRLNGSVGPGATIRVSGTAGLHPGPATFVIKDNSKRDNFRLAGPGVNKATSTAFRGTVTWKTTLQTGRYTFRSDRSKSLRGSFTVK